MLSINLISQRKREKNNNTIDSISFAKKGEKYNPEYCLYFFIIIMICVGTKFSKSLYAKAFKSFTLPYLNIIKHLLVEIL